MKKSLKNFLKSNFFDRLAVVAVIVFMAAGSLVSLHRYWQYEVFYFDFGIYDQAIWSISRFEPPIIDHIAFSGKVIFADHFVPSLFLLSPLYWLTDKSEIILLAQAILVGLSGLVLYKIGVQVLQNKFLSFSVLVSYFFFVGLQNAVISDFHDLTVMTFPLMLVFWAIVRKKLLLYWIAFFITLGSKELTFLLGISIGIFLIFFNKSWLKIGLLTMLLSVVWGVLTIKILIPYFSGGVYLYTPPSLPSSPFQLITGFLDHPLKQMTLFYSFLNFGFLPIFSLSSFPLILQDYGTRFLLAPCCTRWDLGLHYNAQSAVLLAVSALFGLKTIMSKGFIRAHIIVIGMSLIMISFILYRFILHGPFGLAYNPAFYSHTKNFTYLDNLVEKIPKSATVMTQNNLASRFTHQKMRLLREKYEDYKPEYIVLDIRPGQNANNFFVTGNVMDIVKKLKNDEQYFILYQTEYQFIFKRKT